MGAEAGFENGEVFPEGAVSIDRLGSSIGSSFSRGARDGPPADRGASIVPEEGKAVNSIRPTCRLTLLRAALTSWKHALITLA